MLGSSFIALVAVAALVGPGRAQDARPGAVPDAGQEQLDRIEAKLDALLRHLAPEAADTGSDVEVAAPEPEDQSPEDSPETYAPGAVAVVRAAPSEARRLGEVPADSVGGFVYTGGPMMLSDLSDRGVRYTGLAGIELQGWLRATATGRTQIAADLQIGFGKSAITQLPCVFTAWLEGQSIGNAVQAVDPWKHRQKPATVSLVLGAEVQPGLYRLRAWIACAARPILPIQRLQVELLVKAPGEMNLRPVTGEDVLHKAD